LIRPNANLRSHLNQNLLNHAESFVESAPSGNKCARNQRQIPEMIAAKITFTQNKGEGKRGRDGSACK